MKAAIKNLICVSISAVLLFTGCGKKEGEESKSAVNIPMGRYVEKSFDLPLDGDTEALAGFIKDTDGRMNIIVQKRAESGLSYYSRTLQENGSWSEPAAEEWLNSASAGRDDFSVYQMTNGMNGKLYAICRTAELQSHLLVTNDRAAFQEVPMEGWDKKMPLGGSEYYPMIEAIAVAKNGMIAATTYSEGRIYTPEGKKTSYTFETGIQGAALAAGDNRFYTVNGNGDQVIVIAQETGSVLNAIPYEGRDFSTRLLAKDGTIYLFNTKGLHRVDENASTWETIIDGSLNSMSMPTLYPTAVQAGGNDDFYVIFNDSAGSGQKLMHYAYDETVPSVPSNVITVFSLQDNATVRQAIADFQRKNADVKVNYRVAMTEDSATTLSDNIRAFNTELLNGNGADVLILDKMPLDSYIEKGVLEDISDIINPMVSSGELLQNIAKAYESDGKIYAIPSRVVLPVMMGEKSDVEQSKSLETMADLGETSSVPVMESVSNETFLNEMLMLEGGRIMEENGGLREEALVQFLTDMKGLRDKMVMADNNVKSSVFRLGYGSSSFGQFRMQRGEALMSIYDLGGLQDAMLPMAVVDNMTDGVMDTINQTFKPAGIIGVNAAGNNKDIAKAFVQSVLSADVQSADLYDGFPVNDEALEKWIAWENDTLVSVSSSDGGDALTAQWPSETKRKELADMVRMVNTPYTEDSMLLELISAEITPMLEGKITPEAAAEKVLERSGAYLSE